MLSFQNVSFAYQKSAVLKNIELSISKGEYIAVIGPNGGGKTTLLKLIMGFIQPTTGEVKVFGASPKLARPHIGYVPQVVHYDRDFPITCFELVLTGRLARLPWHGRYAAEDKEAVQKVLEELGIASLAYSPIAVLSGGQLQRLFIARALVSNPRLLLLDEPTASIDPEAQEEIYDILKNLVRTMTIVMVTHNLQCLVKEVQRVICVQREAVSMTPEQICEHYAMGIYHPLVEHLKEHH
ncbi:metal ABC transporter ATP-binding protein [Simkania negevensis]|uniref:Metal ABC transporter ATP-binding protein n=1 Tax=Simkania negevensis TaxID=83561 RepID=A0ABS3ARC3_9BACT|nr:metal ABC transporter ATP-binding protein [Simkania negevensis]